MKDYTYPLYDVFEVTGKHNVKLTVKILYDESPENPFESWDMLSIMEAFHTEDALDERALEVMKEKATYNDFYYYSFGVEPYYLLYVPYEKMKKEYGHKIVTKVDKEKALRIIEAEWNTFKNYADGAVYAYEIYTEDGSFVDSCSGYYGDEGIQQAIDEAASMAQEYIPEWEKNWLSLTA